MKRILTLLIVSIVLSSCQDNVKSNNPGFQALKDDVLWKANDARAYISSTGKLTINALTEYEQVTLTTSSTNIGTYNLGSASPINSGGYTSSFSGINLAYGTVPTQGPAYSVTIINNGSGYTSDCSVPTGSTSLVCTSSHPTTATTGTGSGLIVALIANGSGQVTSISRITARGIGYVPGDIVTVAQGNLNCQLRIESTQNSNGQIEITNYDAINNTISGKFKFNAVNTNNNPLGEPVVNFQYGQFFNIPIYPSL